MNPGDRSSTPPDALHAWVVAQWQRMLDTARAATPGPWRARNLGRHDLASVMTGSLEVVVAHLQGNPRTAMDAVHIAAFDPTFTIAVCEAALERLSRHAPTKSRGEVTCSAAWPIHNPLWPCDDLLSDAAPFRTRPDFPEELRRDGQ